MLQICVTQRIVVVAAADADDVVVVVPFTCFGDCSTRRETTTFHQKSSSFTVVSSHRITALVVVVMYSSICTFMSCSTCCLAPRSFFLSLSLSTSSFQWYVRLSIDCCIRLRRPIVLARLPRSLFSRLSHHGIEVTLNVNFLHHTEKRPSSWSPSNDKCHCSIPFLTEWSDTLLSISDNQ